jgi:hypothetical protein
VPAPQPRLVILGSLATVSELDPEPQGVFSQVPLLARRSGAMSAGVALHLGLYAGWEGKDLPHGHDDPI